MQPFKCLTSAYASSRQMLPTYLPLQERVHEGGGGGVRQRHVHRLAGGRDRQVRAWLRPVCDLHVFDVTQGILLYAEQHPEHLEGRVQL